MPKKVLATLIASLVTLILLIAFAYQNFDQQCPVKFFFWEGGKTPISIIIFVSVLIGAFIAMVELVPHIYRFRRRAIRAESELSRLKGEPGKRER